MHRELATSELESFPSLDWSDIAPSLTTPVRSSLEKVLETQDGGDLSLQDSYTLANSGGDDLLGLLVAANLLRAELVGNIVTMGITIDDQAYFKGSIDIVRKEEKAAGK